MRRIEGAISAACNAMEPLLGRSAGGERFLRKRLNVSNPPEYEGVGCRTIE